MIKIIATITITIFVAIILGVLRNTKYEKYEVHTLAVAIALLFIIWVANKF